MKKIGYLILIIFLLTIYCSGKNTLVQKVNFPIDNINSNENDNINILLIVDDNFGSSFTNGDDEIKSIKEQFADFGWNMTIAGLKDTLYPCEWGKSTLGTKPITIDRNISELIDPDEFDAIVILPGRSMLNLKNNSETLKLLKKANQEEIIIAAWCRGVRLLAAADIVGGRNVIGHFDYFDEYKDAGANYIEYSFKWENGAKIFNNVTPPIRDGNIITTVRSLFYRNEMCQLIRKAIEENRK